MIVPAALQRHCSDLRVSVWSIKTAVGLRLGALSPAILALLMYVLTPTYFRPMVGTVVGWVLLTVLATIVGVSYRLAGVAISLLRNARAVLAAVALVGFSITWLVAVSIALLGPAALILMKPRS